MTRAGGTLVGGSTEEIRRILFCIRRNFLFSTVHIHKVLLCIRRIFLFSTVHIRKVLLCIRRNPLFSTVHIHKVLLCIELSISRQPFLFPILLLFSAAST